MNAAALAKARCFSLLCTGGLVRDEPLAREGDRFPRAGATDKRQQQVRTITILSAALFVFPATISLAQHGTANGEWPTYGGDLGNTRYAPLGQITAANFKDLQVAWRFKTDSLGPRPEYNFQSTPLMVDGVVYSTAGSRRDVVRYAGSALSAEPA